MNSGIVAEVAALRGRADALRREAAALDAEADSIEAREMDVVDALNSQASMGRSDGGSEDEVDTLGHVWRSEREGVYSVDDQGRERRLYESEYDPELVRGVTSVGAALAALVAAYGRDLKVGDAAVALLDGGVCKSKAVDRRKRIGRVRSKVYECVKRTEGWERVAEGLVRFVGEQAGPEPISGSDGRPGGRMRR